MFDAEKLLKSQGKVACQLRVHSNTTAVERHRHTYGLLGSASAVTHCLLGRETGSSLENSKQGNASIIILRERNDSQINFIVVSEIKLTFHSEKEKNSLRLHH
jgi:hypothetical protein